MSQSKQHSTRLAFGILAALCTGCATTTSSNTARTGTEQVLISSAIDRAMSSVRFQDFAGYKVFISDKYLDGTVDKGYLVGSIRARVLSAGGSVVASADDADIVLEARSGGIGTDNEKSYVGIPALGMPGLPIELPEVKIISRSSQMGTAKIGLICYDPKTGRALGAGGQANALTHNNDTYVLGIGPFRSGAVVDTRESSVGFDGVGGSLLGSNKPAERPTPVALVDRIPEMHQFTEAVAETEPSVVVLPASAKLK